MSHGQGLETLAWSWAHSFSEQSYWWNLSWKTRANSCAPFLVSPSSLPTSSYACRLAQRLQTTSQSFGRIDGFPRDPSHSLLTYFLPTELSPSYFPQFPSVHVHASVSLPPNGALPKLFPTVSHPSTMSSRPCRSPRGKVNSNENPSIGDASGKNRQPSCCSSFFSSVVVRGIGLDLVSFRRRAEAAATVWSEDVRVIQGGLGCGTEMHWGKCTNWRWFIEDAKINKKWKILRWNTTIRLIHIYLLENTELKIGCGSPFACLLGPHCGIWSV